MKKIAIVNQRGGVSKSTITQNLAVCLTKLNKKVLIIDSDPQASLSVACGLRPDELENTSVIGSMSAIIKRKLFLIFYFLYQ